MTYYTAHPKTIWRHEFHPSDHKRIGDAIIVRITVPLNAEWIHFDYKDEMFQAWEIHDVDDERICREVSLMFVSTGVAIPELIKIEKHIGSMLMDWGNTVWHLFSVRLLESNSSS